MTQHQEAVKKTPAELLAQADALYEQFAQPLEAAHAGEFVAVSPAGQTLLGTSAGEVGRKAKAAFGPGNFVFKVGPRVVGKWR